MTTRGLPLAERLSLHTEPDLNGGCELWNGSQYEFGHGSVRIAGRTVAAHRARWQLEHGPIPAGMQVLHHCDVPQCIRIDHLYLGTNEDNVRDRQTRGRHSNGKAERQGLTRLTNDDVREIRFLRGQGLSRYELTERFDVGYGSLCAILRGDTWKSVEGASPQGQATP